MFSRNWMNRSTENCSDNIQKLKEALQSCDAVIIGAGAGLSTSAGYVYTGENFTRYFSDFHEKYGFSDMYSGGFYPYKTQEEFWAYWSRYIWINRYAPIPGSLYTQLYELVKDKDYFVLTTNVDHCFQRAGFNKKRLFYTQGDYGLWQCTEPCHYKTYDNEETVRRMVISQGYSIGENGALIPPENGKLNMVVPTELVPKCPICGKPMTTNLRADDNFVEDDGWHAAAGRYGDFLARHGAKNFDFWGQESKEPPNQEYTGKMLFLELGVGMNTPGIIKYPFWQMTNDMSNAIYACVNYGQAYAPNEIQNRSICIDGDISAVIDEL